MTEVSTRPHDGATKAPARRKAVPSSAPVAVQPSEADTLVRQALKILQYVVTDIHESNIGAIADAEACAASDVAFLIACPEECDSPPPSTLIGLAEVRQRLNIVFRILEGAETKTLPCAISACAFVLFADQYAQRLESAVTGLPSTIEDLRALTTFAGACPTRPKSRNTSPDPAPTTPMALHEHTAAGCVNAFSAVSEMLECAWQADEAKLACGDSTRLLRLAFNMADEACARPPSAADGQGVAYDIAALVKASRRVPGDTNSTEREELLTIAGKHLAWLTKDEGVLSDEHPNHTVEAKALPLEPDDTKARRSLAFDANYQISMMALGMTRLMGIDRNDETTMYLGMLARIQQLSEIVFFAARLHGDDDDVWGDCAEMKSLLAVFEGRMQ